MSTSPSTSHGARRRVPPFAYIHVAFVTDNGPDRVVLVPAPPTPKQLYAAAATRFSTKGFVLTYNDVTLQPNDDTLTHTAAMTHAASVHLTRPTRSSTRKAGKKHAGRTQPGARRRVLLFQ